MSMPGQWNEAEFASVFSEHYGRILNVVRRVMGNNAEAEEICVEAFLRLYRSGAQTAVSGSVHGWLYRTATRAAIDALRARQRRPYDEMQPGLDPEDQTESPLVSLLRRERIVMGSPN